MASVHFNSNTRKPLRSTDALAGNSIVKIIDDRDSGLVCEGCLAVRLAFLNFASLNHVPTASQVPSHALFALHDSWGETR